MSSNFVGNPKGTFVARKSDLRSYLSSSQQAKRGGGLLAAGALALAGAALIVNRRSAAAERSHPPLGSFVTSEDVRLHYVERGNGPPVVFLHGNGVMIEDMLISRVVDQTARFCRAIAFDRPGFGHSERPRDHSWTAAAQAALLPRAFALLGIDRPIVVGHSWGTMVALALALDHPEHVSGLVLASGYYYPTARTDVVLFSPPAIPVLGDVLCYTVAPLIGEAMAPRMFKKMFAPQPVPARFEQEFPVGLTLRPSQIRASSEDASNMISDAKALSERYAELSCPVAILAGDADGVVSYQQQALRLHKELSASTLDVFAGAGHMIHHADPARVVRAIKVLRTSETRGRESALAV
jgi:pimeloyl-ACP methyl ester carboxylesterase